ncbi:MAG: lipopolysaccharide biosynthesis protein [Candidatus Acidiferrales bacterium]
MPTDSKSADPLNTEHLKGDLRGRSLRGGLLTLTSQGTQFFLQLIFTVVLAHLLTPADFGLVAMVTAVTSLGQAFADLGLSEATIQRQEITHDQVSVLFWINLMIGAGLTLITASIAPLLAWFYREPRLVMIALVLSPTFLIGGLRVQPDALLKRQMRYKSLAYRDVAAYAFATLTAVIMAWRGFGYWSIVAFPLTVNLTVMTLSWLMVGWRPSLPRRGARVREMVVFGGHVAASYLIDTLNRNFSNIAIGWYWGASPLGLFSRAYNLLMRPVTQLTGPAAGVAIPAFSRISAEPERFARYYLRGAGLLMWISAPIFGFLFVVAKPVVILVLGHRWEEAAPVFQILAVSALAQPLLQSASWVLVSRGHSDRLLKLSLITSPIIVGSFLLGLPFGIKWVAASYSIVLLAALPWILRYSFRGTNITLRGLGKALVYPVTPCLAGVIVAELSMRFVDPTRMVSEFLVAILSFAATYSLSVLIPSAREELVALKRLSSELRLFGQTT